MPEIMVTCGEASGDLHAAAVINKIKELYPEEDWQFFGMGGETLAGAGVEILFDPSRVSSVGFLEALRHLRDYRQALRILEGAVRDRRPDLLFMVDFSGFNLKMAGIGARYHLPMVNYFAPSAWIWGRWRAGKMARRGVTIASVFPREKEVYEEAGAEVVFVGHPILDMIDYQEIYGKEEGIDYQEMYGKEGSGAGDNIPFSAGGMDEPATEGTEEHAGERAEQPAAGRAARNRALKGIRGIPKQIALNEPEPVIGILPGSRLQEVEKLLPVFLSAAALILKEYPCTLFLIPRASTISREILQKILADTPGLPRERVVIVDGHSHRVMAASDVLLLASGTASLEAACIGTPMVICYRLSTLTYHLARLLVRGRDKQLIGLPNIILEEEVFPELLQEEVDPGRITREVLAILGDEGLRREMAFKMAEMRRRLGNRGAVERVARLVARKVGVKE